MTPPTYVDGSFRLRVGDEVFVPTTNEHGDLRCPCCGSDDISVWADDGEADDADWFDCQTRLGGCGVNGALVRATDTKVTQNGLPAKGETLLERAYRLGEPLGGLDVAGVKLLVEMSRENEKL